MDVDRECLQCGARFRGRPNRWYCSPACKAVAKRCRRRRRFLLAQLDHCERQRRVAELAGDHRAASTQAWRVRQLLAELRESEKGSQRGSQRGYEIGESTASNRDTVRYADDLNRSEATDANDSG